MSKTIFHPEGQPYFYAPDILETLHLNEEEATHAFKVLRLQNGDQIYITDGKGHLYSAVVLDNNPKVATITDLQLCLRASATAPQLEIAIAPTKNIDRIEWLLEKLTEISIQRLALVITERTIRKRINLERMNRVMVSAMKQSEKLNAVEINLYNSLEEYLSEHPYPNRYIAYCGDKYNKSELKKVFATEKDTSFLIGPEGDFSESEVEQAIQEGFLPVSLGNERLRTETAGLYVGMLHHILNE